MSIKTSSLLLPHSDTLPSIHCVYCGEGVSNRPEDDKAAKEFKAKHKACKKDKNNNINWKHLPDAPI